MDAPGPASAASRVLELQLELEERDAMLRQMEELWTRATDREVALMSEMEELRKRAADREVALLSEADELRRRTSDRVASLLSEAEEAAERVHDLEMQLMRARQHAGAADARSLSQALSGETSTASHAELAAATGGFAASSILGRGGFGPVYRGEWGGQAVAVKRLDQVCPPLLICA